MSDDERLNDLTTISHLIDAEKGIERALRTMPNKVASVFMSSDPRDLDQALRMVRRVRADAEMALERRGT